jgi:Tfp pilus assembly major pilin PilA
MNSRPLRDLAPTDREAGFSLIEVLISSVMVVSIALSTIPMFTNSMVNNTAGMDSTKVANEARGHLERLVELSFGSPVLTLSAGAEKETSEYFSMLDQSWHPFPLPAANTGVVWTRVTTIRQYGLSAIADGVLDPIEALDVDAVAEAIHLKEIEIAVVQSGALFGGRAKRITLKTLKVK